MSSGADSAQTAPKKSVFGRLNDFVFGYDFFVSYCWADGREYAVALVRQLQDQGFECFLDSSDYAKGDDWRDQGRRALKKTSRLILVGTPKAVVSEPVQNELAIFSRLRRRILPIDFDGSLSNAPADSAVSRYLTADTLFIKESSQTVRIGPSPETIDAIRGTFKLMRQQQKRTRLFAFATVVFAVISLVAIGLYSVASRRQAESMALALGAQGEAIFNANPVEGLYLARKGWKTVPDGSHSLNQRLSGRVLGLAEQGRLVRIGTDILDAGLTDDGKLFIARRHTRGEIRYGDDLRRMEQLPGVVLQVSEEQTGDYIVLTNRDPINGSNFAFRRRDNGALVGYRKRLEQPPLPFFPHDDARYFYSDTGISATITRLSDRSVIGHGGFDIMEFHYESSWPVFTLSFRDDEIMRRPPDAELFDLHSGKVIHKFPDRTVDCDENLSGDYSVTRFTRPEDGRVEATVYASTSAYIVASASGLTLRYLGQALTLTELPAKIVAGEIGGQPYVLLLYEERSEIWSMVDQRRLGEFPKLASTDFIPTLGGWLVTPTSAGDDSLLLTMVSGELISRPMGARISWKDRRADAQSRYFITNADDKALQLRRTHDASLVPLSAPVAWFSFPRDESTPLFAVHYKGAQPSEIRRIADGSLVHTLAHNGKVEVEFEGGEFFIVNYFKSRDPEPKADFRSELRRSEDAILVTSEKKGILRYTPGPGGEMLVLTRGDGDLRVLIRSATGYQQLKKVIRDVSQSVIFHPDPSRRTFVTTTQHEQKNAPGRWSAAIHQVVPEDEHPGSFIVLSSDFADTSANTVDLFSTTGADYLLTAKEGERVTIWNFDAKPRRIFVSQIGLAGFLRLPGEGRLFLWYDDGSAYVIDVRLADLASAAAESEDPMVRQRFLRYIEEELFKSHWLDQTVIDDQLESMRLD